MLEQFQRQQDADREGPAATRGASGKALGNTVLNGADQRRPGKGIGPLTEGMARRHKICDVQTGSGAAQPMLEITNHMHRWLSC